MPKRQKRRVTTASSEATQLNPGNHISDTAKGQPNHSLKKKPYIKQGFQEMFGVVKEGARRLQAGRNELCGFMLRRKELVGSRPGLTKLGCLRLRKTEVGLQAGTEGTVGGSCSAARFRAFFHTAHRPRMRSLKKVRKT